MNTLTKATIFATTLLASSNAIADDADPVDSIPNCAYGDDTSCGYQLGSIMRMWIHNTCSYSQRGERTVALTWDKWGTAPLNTCYFPITKELSKKNLSDIWAYLTDGTGQAK